eukprot:365100-Chlamydomonas_euryale.AAC.1
MQRARCNGPATTETTALCGVFEQPRCGQLVEPLIQQHCCGQLVEPLIQQHCCTCGDNVSTLHSHHDLHGRPLPTNQRPIPHCVAVAKGTAPSPGHVHTSVRRRPLHGPDARPPPRRLQRRHRTFASRSMSRSRALSVASSCSRASFSCVMSVSRRLAPAESPRVACGAPWVQQMVCPCAQEAKTEGRGCHGGRCAASWKVKEGRSGQESGMEDAKTASDASVRTGVWRGPCRQFRLRLQHLRPSCPAAAQPCPAKPLWPPRGCFEA